MKEWQFNVLFLFALIGAIFLMVSPVFGIKISPNGLIGYSAILTFVLARREDWTKKDRDGKHKDD